MGRQTRRSPCNHNWIEDFNPTDDAAAYNDGFNYTPAYQVCTKCGKRKRINSEPGLDWGFLPLVPFFLVGVLMLDALTTVFVLLASVREVLLSKRES